MTNSKSKVLHVYLGRFAPFHEGHKILLSKLVKTYGAKKCLVLVGSANVLNERTPFTADYRIKLIKRHFPEIKIIPINDVEDDSVWLSNLNQLEKKLGSKFIFYGGSKRDLEILSLRFETHVLVDRETEGKGISATQIRRSLRRLGKLF